MGEGVLLVLKRICSFSCVKTNTSSFCLILSPLQTPLWFWINLSLGTVPIHMLTELRNCLPASGWSCSSAGGQSAESGLSPHPHQYAHRLEVARPRATAYTGQGVILVSIQAHRHPLCH